MSNTQTATGISGKVYEFETYRIGTTFNDLPGVYIFSREIASDKHDAIYVGITEDLSERFDNHHKMGCIKLYHASHISVLVEHDKNERARIEEDLIKGLKPHCNDTHK
jgi:predicted GIY-YIG superfamily endonuclease